MPARYFENLSAVQSCLNQKRTTARIDLNDLQRGRGRALDLGKLDSWTWNQESWTLDFGLWALAFGLWNLEFGLWALEFGIWNLEFGLQFRTSDSYSQLISPPSRIAAPVR